SLTPFCPDIEKAFKKLLGLTLASMDIGFVPDFYMIHYCNYRDKKIIGLSFIKNTGEANWEYDNLLLPAESSASKDLSQHRKTFSKLQACLFSIFEKHIIEQIDKSIEETVSLQENGELLKSPYLTSIYGVFCRIFGDS
ncbi:MAG: hypothetical protein F6K48_14050, partial [Okeania sp. SIO3H1]|nr:hypothetical protein [Okeania sp. SIO3H1]